MTEDVCRKCRHPVEEHNGPSGECRHGYNPFRPHHEDCICKGAE